MLGPSGAGPFPLPCVQAPRLTRSRSRRVRQRQRRAAVAAEMTNSAISALNALHTPPSNSMQSSNLPHTSFSAASLRAVAHISSCANQFVSRLAPSYVLEGPLRDDAPFPYSPTDPGESISAPYVSTTPAIPLSAAAVSLPTEGGFVNLLDLLPPDLAAQYAQPTELLLRPPAERKRAPRACLVRSPGDYHAIIRRLAKLTMVTFTTSPKVVNGVFGTPKSGGAIRFVVDGRPMNATFTPSPKVELPTPDLLTRNTYFSKTSLI